jgi:hypothetical protein
MNRLSRFSLICLGASIDYCSGCLAEADRWILSPFSGRFLSNEFQDTCNDYLNFGDGNSWKRQYMGLGPRLLAHPLTRLCQDFPRFHISLDNHVSTKL